MGVFATMKEKVSVYSAEAKEKGFVSAAVSAVKDAFNSVKNWVSGKINFVKDKVNGNDYDPKYDTAKSSHYYRNAEATSNIEAASKTETDDEYEA